MTMVVSKRVERARASLSHDLGYLVAGLPPLELISCKPHWSLFGMKETYKGSCPASKMCGVKQRRLKEKIVICTVRIFWPVELFVFYSNSGRKQNSCLRAMYNVIVSMNKKHSKTQNEGHSSSHRVNNVVRSMLLLNRIINFLDVSLNVLWVFKAIYTGKGSVLATSSSTPVSGVVKPVVYTL